MMSGISPDLFHWSRWSETNWFVLLCVYRTCRYFGMWNRVQCWACKCRCTCRSTVKQPHVNTNNQAENAWPSNKKIKITIELSCFNQKSHCFWYYFSITEKDMQKKVFAVWGRQTHTQFGGIRVNSRNITSLMPEVALVKTAYLAPKILQFWFYTVFTKNAVSGSCTVSVTALLNLK